MVKLDFSIVKKGKITIGETEYEISPLTGKNISLFSTIKKGKEDEMFIKMVTATLQQIDPDVKVEDVEKIPLGDFQKILQEVLRINELLEQ